MIKISNQKLQPVLKNYPPEKIVPSNASFVRIISDNIIKKKISLSLIEDVLTLYICVRAFLLQKT